MIGIFIFAAFLQAVAHVHSEGGTCSDSKGWDTENTIYKNLEYREKKFVFIQCKYEGFRVDGDHTIECVHGQPAKPLPQCKLMRQSCISLKDPPNGSKWCSPTAPEVGSWCSFRCTGTHYLQGSERRDCGQDHRWTGQEAQCLPYSTTLNIGCRPLDAPFFGWKSCSPNGKDIGSVCTFECNDTHYLRGSKERRCTQNNEWSGTSTRCMLKPECSLPILDDKIRTECSLHRKVKLNEVCSFSCGEGFQLKGPDQLKCQLSGLLVDNEGKQTYPSCHSVRNPCTTSNCQQFCRSVSGRAQCYCAEGFSLTENGRTCSDIDECKTNTDNCQQECRNSIGSYSCGCRQGFTLIDRFHCEENKPHRGKEGTEKIPGSKRPDSCQFHNGDCFHTCKVEFGNVRCGCTTGFELENDGKRCRKIVVPVDSRPTLQLSCADRNGLCSHVCSDEEFGGVRCSCPEGFRLLWNNRACEEISISNEFTLPLILETRRTCAHRNGFCSQMCSEDEHRGVRCSCREGFKLLWDKITCDEVSASTYSRPRSCADSNGFCSQVCSSVDHGVRCSCLRGFQLLSDKRTCVDIDECFSGEFECFQCVNTPGSYECLCPEGFRSISAIQCESCRKNSYKSVTDASCIDCPSDSQTDGEGKTSVRDCVCNPGFTGNPARGIPCKDIDECKTNTHYCQQKCRNSIGSYTCGCSQGFTLIDKLHCEEIVEPVDSRPTVQLSCADHNGLCSHVCSDEEFGCVRCSCPEEFRLLWNNRTCEEISVTGNESSFPLILNTRRTCAHRNGFCSQMCSEDEHGGVRCSCHEGFKLLWDTTTCDEVSASTYSRPRSCADSNGFCSQVCRNGNRGVRCSCRKGFQLLSDERTCVDIDECSSGEFECFRCVNTPGSYECLCPEGFVARAIRCEKLVEPVDSRPTVPRSCADSNGFCSHVCREWHSDIQCSCPEGFRLLPDRRTCVDVDECANSVLNKCDHDCHNTEGGYSCSCRAGYISYNGFKCEGCRKNSYQSVTDASCIDCPPDSQTDGEGKTSVRDCVCKPGFTGNPARGIPCKDINECAASDNFGCSHNCLNVPGSAICTCSPGFQLQEDQKTCSDIDECSLKNGGCDGVCHNTVGNFTCSCDEGYVPSEVDRYSCVDVNECKENNGGCMDICENFQGGYQCLCSEGYHVHPDGKSCIAIHCPKVYVPHHSSLRCKDSPRSNRTVYRPGIVPEDIQFPVGALCKVKCDKGYDLHPSPHPIICQNNGKWNATPPECQVLQCPPLLPPEHGDVYPPSCKDGTIQVKEKCIFTCLQGFRITGQEVFTCNNNLKWDVKNGTQCLPETDAFIVCPEDITVELMPNETSAEIFLVPPKSNIEPILVRPDWISLDRVNFFPAEETKVMFYVEDSYNKAECNISVFVIDKEPPFFLDCPETLSVTGSGSQGTVVDWQEPIADDNVGIASITKTLEPNSTLYSGIHLVQYVARDFAGNMGMCSFEINITSEGCSELADPLNGEANCFEWTSGMICTPLCDTNFTRPPEEPEFYTCEDSGTWTPSDFISPCLPESSRHPEQTGNLTDLVNE